MKAGLEREKAAILVVIGALSDGTKTVLSVVPCDAELVGILRDRGMNCPKLVVGDGVLNQLPFVIRGARPQDHKRSGQATELMLRGIPFVRIGASEVAVCRLVS